MKKQKNKKILLILGLIVLVCIIIFFVGRSFGFFRYVKEGNVTNIITIKGIEVEILNPENDSLNLENVYPVSDSEGLTYTPFEFTITNTSSRSLNYSILVVNDMEKQADCILEDGTKCPELSTDYIRYSYKKNDGTYTTTRNLGNNGDIIDNGIIEGKETVTSSIIIWIDEKAGNEIMNHYFYGKVIIVGSANTSENYEETLLNGADPVLTDNLVPVKIDDKGIVTKANIKEEWYSYNRKEWANAVVLKDRYDTNTIYDLSGNNNHATIYGATITDEGLYFDGVDDYAKIDLLDWNSTTEFTVEFEAQIFQNDSINALFELSTNANNYAGAFILTNQIGKNDLNFGTYYHGDYTKTAENALIDNLTKTYTITFNSNNTYDNFLSIYVNGTKQELSNPLGHTTNINGTVIQDYPFFIGSRNGQNFFTKMILKSLKIYTKELTQEEINNNLNNNTTTDKLILMYDLNDYSNGEIIPEEIIESYFVWIPKYSYQLWDLGNYSSLTSIDSTKPHAIPIKFGTTNTSDSKTGECTTPGVSGESGNCKVGDYMTHPAFLAFDTNGLWVGKFETGYDGATSTATAQIDSSDSSKIIIKPNVYSWRNLTVGNMFKASYEYLRDDDSHMMKNTEWGAAAYLSHSIYGTCSDRKCSEVRINNNSKNITGYAGAEQPTVGYNNGRSIEGNRIEGVDMTTDGMYTLNYLNKLSNIASTTGNYTGIYDISGGSWEYVMGYTTGSTTVGGLSEITTLYSDFLINSSWEKYYDKYSSISNKDYSNRILGDATGEMGPFISKIDIDNVERDRTSWDDDYAHFVSSSLSWFSRGGDFVLGTTAGTFAFRYARGNIDTNISYRIVLAPTE